MAQTAETLRRKNLEQQKRLALFDIILQNVDYGIVVTNGSGKKVYENGVAEIIRKKYLAKKRLFLDKQGEAIAIERMPYNRAIADNKVRSLIFEIETKRNEPETWYHVTAVPVFDNRKKLVFVVTTWREVTNLVLEERRREHFIAIGSHELRTPLAGIKALNQVLSKLYYEKRYDDARSFFHKIDNKVNLLTKIIQDFIEVEKIRSGKLEFAPEQFDFDELVSTTVQEMNSIFKSHRVSIDGSAKAKIIADRERIYEVLTNLIGNARKYSPEADKIDVHVSADTHRITVGVKDYGIGLTKEHVSNIFEPFYRVKDPAMEKVHGLGLGLYISFKIVELHGGRMWVKSKRGAGSTFFFTIPRIIKKTKRTYEF